MDHLFEQKLVNEQIALRNTLAQQDKKAKELMEQIQAYDLMLENFAVSYLENGGSPEELQELFDMAGMKEKGKAIVGKVASGVKKAAKVGGRLALAASLVASPAQGMKKVGVDAIPGTPGSPAQAAVIEKGTTTTTPAKTYDFSKGVPAFKSPEWEALGSAGQAAAVRHQIGTGNLAHIASGIGREETGGFMGIGAKPTGRVKAGAALPSTGGPARSDYRGKMSDDAVAAHLNDLLDKNPEGQATTTTTPDRVVKPAVPAVAAKEGAPKSVAFNKFMTAVPNQREYVVPERPGVRRRRGSAPSTGPVDVKPVSGSESTESTPSHVGAFSVPRGRPIVPQRTPSPSPTPSPNPSPNPSPAPTVTPKKFPVSTVPGRIQSGVGTTATARPASVGKVPAKTYTGRLARFEESVEGIIRNILNEG